jgi:hypothetical protein
MKRKTAAKSLPAATSARSINARRLAAVRGGLDIAVVTVTPPRPDMQNQHNETLIQL